MFCPLPYRYVVLFYSWSNQKLACHAVYFGKFCLREIAHQETFFFFALYGCREAAAPVLVCGTHGAAEHVEQIEFWGLPHSEQKPTQLFLQPGEWDKKIKAFFLLFWEIKSRGLYECKDSEMVFPHMDVQHAFPLNWDRKRIKELGVGKIFFSLL